jgi:hypothetical protein
MTVFFSLRAFLTLILHYKPILLLLYDPVDRISYVKPLISWNLSVQILSTAVRKGNNLP